MPLDEATRIVEFKNSKYSLTNNPDKNRFTQFYMSSQEGSNRNEIIIFDGNAITDIYYNLYSVFYLEMQHNSVLYFTNNLLIDIIEPGEGIGFLSIKNAVITNNTYQNSTWSSLVYFIDVDNLQIDKLFFDKLTAIGDSSTNFIYFYVNEGSFVKINSILIKNSDINDQKFIYWDTIVPYISITNAIFDNLTINSQNSLINIDSANEIIFENLTFLNIKGGSEDSYESYILHLSRFNLEGIENSSISKILINDSQIGFINFNYVPYDTPISKSLSISDLIYTNWDFKSQYNLIVFDGIETTSDFKLILTRITFQNINFYFNGNLIYMNSQMKNQLLIQDSYANNVTGGSIWIESFNKKNTNINANIKLSNFTVNNLSSKYSSFIQNFEGGNLEITSSSFKYIMSYESGSVLTAGYQRSTTMINLKLY